MNQSTWIIWALETLFSFVLLASPLVVPAFREALGKYIARFVQHRFDERIEKLKSDLRLSEEKFAADLRANQQQLRSLADVTLSLRSSRQAALDARRLQAVEKLWAAKIATDRMIMAARLVSSLNMDEMFKVAETGDPKISKFAGMLDQMTGLDLKKDAIPASALTEQPFLPPKVWVIFSAYQSIIVTSVLFLKALADGASKFLNKEDLLKPTMLLALPEYKDYIEKYGFSGYYHLLEVLNKKLLQAITEMLEGRDLDDATLKRSAEIISTAQQFSVEKKLEIPESLRGPEIPDPPKV
jgi:hypothetical protein